MMRRLVLLSAILCVSGCSLPAAKIHLKDGTRIRAPILDGDAEFIYVQSRTVQREPGDQDPTSTDGDSPAEESDTVFMVDAEELAIARSEIADIDHPGNIPATIGGLASVIGAVVFGAFMYDARRPDSGMDAIGSGMMAIFVGFPTMVGGLSPFISGMVTWGSSRARARSPDAEPGRKGLTLGFQF